MKRISSQKKLEFINLQLGSINIQLDESQKFRFASSSAYSGSLFCGDFSLGLFSLDEARHYLYGVLKGFQLSPFLKVNN
jgi:hypothetical protein